MSASGLIHDLIDEAGKLCEAIDQARKVLDDLSDDRWALMLRMADAGISDAEIAVHLHSTTSAVTRNVERLRRHQR